MRRLVSLVLIYVFCSFAPFLASNNADSIEPMNGSNIIDTMQIYDNPNTKESTQSEISKKELEDVISNAARVLFIKEEPYFTMIKDRIKERKNYVDENTTFQFSENPKNLIIGDSRVCGFRNTKYLYEGYDILGVRGGRSETVKDLLSFFEDEYYDNIILWFAANNYISLSKYGEVSTTSQIFKKEVNNILNVINEANAKAKNKVFFVKNKLGEKNAFNNLNPLIDFAEDGLREYDNCIVLQPIIDEDSKYTFDGLHYDHNGYSLIIDDLVNQIKEYEISNDDNEG